jgi:thermophilic serine proteinase
MKKIFVSIVSIFFVMCLSSQEYHRELPKLIKSNNQYQINYSGRVFYVDTLIVTVKSSDLHHIKTRYTVVRTNKLGYADVKVPTNVSFLSFVEKLSIDSKIKQIEYSMQGYYNAFVSNDTHLNKQWYLSAINAFDAWTISCGNANIVVAILDSGVDWLHQDLGRGNDNHDNIHTNSNEDIWIDINDPQTGNKIDDDKNMLIDDWKGWNYDNNTNNTITSNYHGTFVAGIIGAKTNNNLGIAGIVGGNNSIGGRIIPYCVGVQSPISSILDDAIIDAIDKGARIIQLSLTIPFSQSVEDAIQYAINNNAIIVCASGNSGATSVGYPSSNSNVIAVGAIQQNLSRVFFSNYGDNLDIVAPGVDIYSTKLANAYDYSDGTSFASPQVSGVAALILSVNPNLTGQEVRDIIEKTAQKVRPDLYNYQSDQSHPNGTWNNEMGYGLVDAYAAVKMAKIPDTPADLLIRDYVGDDGEEPSYGYNGWLYKLLQYNPDIKLLDIDTQQPIHSIGMYKKKNCYIAVNIKNIGGKTTEGNGKERLHLFSQSYLITTLPKYVLPYYERLTPTKGLPIGKLAYNEQKVAAGLFNWELPEKKLKATAERLKEAFPSVNNPIWGFDILAIADENGSSIIKSTADTVFIAHGAEDIARRYNSAAMGYWQRRTLWDDIFNQIIRILPTANKPFSLSLGQPVDIKRGRIKDFAEVNILLSNSLMAKLITAGNPNIKVIDQNRVRLLSADAKLEFRPMSNNKEDYFAGVEVKFFSDLLPQINSFDFGLSYSEQGKEPEMVHFTAIRNSSVYFKAQAEASKTQIADNETVTLTATNIGDEATYTWYNRSGNVIGTGTSITTVPTATDTYTLEVEREDNGYKSYGEVEVVALAGKIVSLSPNPAHSTLTVKYKLPDNAVIASIQITNIQNNISKTYAISTTATEKTISLEGLSVGSYIVKLIADGKTLHSQNLLIK